MKKDSRMLDSLLDFLHMDPSLTVEKLQEATNSAYESKLPQDPSKIEDPAGDIVKLAEDDKKEKEPEKDPAENPEIKTDNAGITPKPEETEVSKEADKASPGTDKLSDADVAAGVAGKVELGNKEEKKEEVKVTGVVTANPENESALPADPSQVADPAGDIVKLSEEKVLTTVTDPVIANDIKSKYPGSHVVEDRDDKGNKVYIVMVRERRLREGLDYKKVVEDIANVVTDDGIDEDEKIQKIYELLYPKAAEARVKEATEVTVKTDDKEAKIVLNDDGTVKTTATTTTAAAPEVIAPPVEEPKAEEPGEEEEELSDEEATEVAESMFLAEHLRKQGMDKLTEKELSFVKKVDEKKLGKKGKAKVDKKLECMGK